MYMICKSCLIHLDGTIFLPNVVFGAIYTYFAFVCHLSMLFRLKPPLAGKFQVISAFNSVGKFQVVSANNAVGWKVSSYIGFCC